MPESSTVTSALRCYPSVEVRQVHPLGGAGGFSGAAFWKVETGDRPLCLRRWPQEHPGRTQLQAIHDVLCHVSANGFAKLPIPFRSRDGGTFVSLAGHFWELAHWLPGKADFHQQPTSRRLDAALTALAQFHRCAESFELRVGPPPGIVSRREHLERLCAGGASELRRAVSALAWPEFQQRAVAILHRFNELASNTRPLLEPASRLSVPLQPCIRDIWHDHVLFEEDEVSGFVDFGAMRTDHVACDISRLLGSLVGGDREGWQQGLAAYQALRHLSADDLMLVDAYDRSTVLLSGMNWARWIAVEGRKFDDHKRVWERMDEIIGRMHHICTF
ncbi:MAG: phosphotransferase [Planctomycetota bacterium]|nr:phosphotransferase [Planctomycetota bacterium]